MFLVRWATANPLQQRSWESSEAFPEDHPLVCAYRLAQATSYRTVSTQTENSFWIASTSPVLHEPDPFRRFLPACPRVPTDRELIMVDRGVPIRIIEFHRSRNTFSVMLADTEAITEIVSETMMVVDPVLVADFFIAQEAERLAGLTS
jgi:hypothetical protein